MIKYEIENGSIMQIETLLNATIRASVGSEKQLNLISETESEKVYQWQRFNLGKGVYEDDTENNEVATIDGKEYTPKNGKVVVHKMNDKQRIQELEIALTEQYEANLKLQDKVAKQEETLTQVQLAMTEIYEKSAP